ncbi:hypothetical protein ACI65C_010116 [Semiaphis heraclei]
MTPILPNPNTHMKFENWKQSQKHPYAIYADFESLLQKENNFDIDSNTRIIHHRNFMRYCYDNKPSDDILSKELSEKFEIITSPVILNQQLKDHKIKCNNNTRMTPILPNPNTYMKFENWNQSQKHPFTIHADSHQSQEENNFDIDSNTRIIHHHDVMRLIFKVKLRKSWQSYHQLLSSIKYKEAWLLFINSVATVLATQYLLALDNHHQIITITLSVPYEEQLNKYLLDTLQNEMSKKTNSSELRETQTGQTYLQQLFNGETSGCEDEHDEHTADITNNNGAVAVLEPDKSTTEMDGDETLSRPNTDRWPKNHVLVLIDAFEKNKNLFSSTTVRKEKRNKKATSSGQCAFHFEFEEEFDRIYKEEPSFTPVALAANLIQEESAKHYNIDDIRLNTHLHQKKRKTDSLSNMYLFMEKKEESREKRHQESIELQKKSLKLQQDAVEAYSSTMNQFLAIYKKNSNQ